MVAVAAVGQRGGHRARAARGRHLSAELALAIASLQAWHLARPLGASCTLYCPAGAMAWRSAQSGQVGEGQ